MRSIETGPEPPCLAGLRRHAHQLQRETGRRPVARDREPGPCAQALREALCRDQQGLCAYCMQRIEPHGYRSKSPDSEADERGGMKIEHFAPRSTHPEKMYDWDNLLGVCGGEAYWQGRPVRHCDASRGNRELAVHPAGGHPPRPEEAFEFKRSPPPGFRDDPSPTARGIWLHARTPEYQEDIEILNLNAGHLVHNRGKVIDSIRLQLAHIREERAIRDFLRKQWRAVTTPGPKGLPPFAPLVADYLRKKMRVRGMEPP